MYLKVYSFSCISKTENTIYNLKRLPSNDLKSNLQASILQLHLLVER